MEAVINNSKQIASSTKPTPRKTIQPTTAANSKNYAVRRRGLEQFSDGENSDVKNISDLKLETRQSKTKNMSIQQMTERSLKSKQIPVNPFATESKRDVQEKTSTGSRLKLKTLLQNRNKDYINLTNPTKISISPGSSENRPDAKNKSFLVKQGPIEKVEGAIPLSDSTESCRNENKDDFSAPEQKENGNSNGSIDGTTSDKLHSFQINEDDGWKIFVSEEQYEEDMKNKGELLIGSESSEIGRKMTGVVPPLSPLRQQVIIEATNEDVIVQETVEEVVSALVVIIRAAFSLSWYIGKTFTSSVLRLSDANTSERKGAQDDKPISELDKSKNRMKFVFNNFIFVMELILTLFLIVVELTLELIVLIWKFARPWKAGILFNLISGLMICFFGGKFALTMTAFEAFCSCSYKTILNDVRKMAEDVQHYLRSIKYGESSNQPEKVLLISHFYALIYNIDPNTLFDATRSISVGMIGVTASLRSLVVKNVALGNGIAQALEPMVMKIGQIILSFFLSKHMQRWSAVIIKYSLKLTAIYCAMKMKTMTSVYHSSFRGAFIASRSLLKLIAACQYIADNQTESDSKDESERKSRIQDFGIFRKFSYNQLSFCFDILGYVLALLGLYVQVQQFDFSAAPWKTQALFPFNILLVPFLLMESILLWFVSSSYFMQVSGYFSTIS